MKFRVVLTARASSELEGNASWWAQHRSTAVARRWYSGFSDLLAGLADSPGRHSLALETEEFPYELRELHFGLGSRPTHRALFTIIEDAVIVLSIRHAAQDRLTPGDL